MNSCVYRINESLQILCVRQKYTKLNSSTISTDITNNKHVPRTSRRREPTGTSSFSKYEQPRKCNVQKAKSFDKRPKPKGQYYGSSKEDTKVRTLYLIFLPDLTLSILRMCVNDEVNRMKGEAVIMPTVLENDFSRKTHTFKNFPILISEV